MDATHYSPKPFFTKTQEPYIVLLEKKEWKIKRDGILMRDHFKCQNCGAEEETSELHVHHKFYIEGLDPWEYNDSDLVTLCERCHSDLHNSRVVPYYWEKNGNLYQFDKRPCSRCNGAGYFPEYHHVQRGICFRCLGQRFEESVSFVRQYETEHGISIIDTCWGFEPLTNDVITQWIKEDAKMDYAEVQHPYSDYGRSRVDIVLHTGRIVPAYLDYSYEAKPGDRLDVHSLVFRIGRRQDGTVYPIVKDRFIPLNDDSLSRIASQITGQEKSYHICGAHVGGDEELGPELLRAIIETTSGDLTMALYMRDAELGMKLDPNTLMYSSEHFSFMGKDKTLYLVKGKPLRD